MKTEPFTLQAAIKRILIALGVCTILMTGSLPVNASENVYVEIRHSRLIKTKKPITRAAVANPKTADVEVLTPTSVLLIAKSKTPASTSLILWFGEDHVRTYDIHVFSTIPAKALTALKKRILGMAPGVTVELLDTGAGENAQTLILNGEVSSQQILNQVLNLVKGFGMEPLNLIKLTGSQQVQLKVMIAEVSNSALRDMGINFAHVSDNFGVGIYKGGSTSSFGESDNDSNSGDLEYTIGESFSSAFQIAMVSTKGNWLGVLSLLKTQGLARSLATPTLVTMNGQKAQFQAGGEYPVPMEGEDGPTIEHKEYGVMLSFTPYIIDKDTITLEVSPEVSSLDYSVEVSSGGTTVPGLNTRKATTTLQLKSGQTFAMAGLMQENYYQTVHKIPFLGDMPFIGSLFTAKEHSISESELVVMVTPTIVRAMNPAQVPGLPGNEIKTRTTDTDFFIQNDLDTTKQERTTRTEFKGKTGFIK